MRKKLLLPIPGVLLLLLWLFNKAYGELNTYTELKDRHDAVLSHFQNVSKEVNNAAMLSPGLVKAIGLRPNISLLTDSNTVMLTSSKESPDVQKCCEPVKFEGFAAAIKTPGFYWLLLNQPPENK